MKKLLALLLVVCMVASLGACKKKPAEQPGGSTGQTQETTEATGKATTATEKAAKPSENKNETESSTETTGKTDTPKDSTNKTDDAPTDSIDKIDPPTDSTGADTPVVPDDWEEDGDVSFEGKKLQIYGYSSSTYEDLDNMDKGTFIWMVRAAVDEWAHLNNVEVEYVGGYDQSVILGDINAGGCPDLLLYCNKFPLPALTGITRAFTPEEYEALAATCGTYYLDMLKYKGQSYGVLAPWSGGNLLYFNKTLFEKHGVKSPAEYFMEGNWNFDTYEKCVTDMLWDEDGDGRIDTYGSGSTMFLIPEFYYRKLNEDGTLTSLMRNSEAYKRYIDIYYTVCENKVEGRYAPAYIDTTPRPATSIGDTHWYDFELSHRVLNNGDVIEVVPAPKYTNDSESFYQHTTVYSSILSTCDEPEATVSLINYILQAGMRYMSDLSLGLYKCDYEGITGASEYSAGWKQRFDAIVAQRQETFDNFTDWDQALFEKTMDYILNADVHFVPHDYPVMDSAPSYSSQRPNKDNALNLYATREEAWMAEYNKVYAK